MSLDLLCIAVVVLAAAAGALAGAVRQLGRLGAVVAGWAGARLLGPTVTPMLQGRVPPFAAQPLASVVTFVACTVLAAVAVTLLFSITPLRSVRGGGPDRGVGALLAGAKAALVLWVALSALAAWGKPVRLGGFVLDPSGSDAASFAREYSALGSWSGKRG